MRFPSLPLSSSLHGADYLYFCGYRLGESISRSGSLSKTRSRVSTAFSHTSYSSRGRPRIILDIMKDESCDDAPKLQEIARDEPVTRKPPARSNDLPQVTSVPLMQVSLRNHAYISSRLSASICGRRARVKGVLVDRVVQPSLTLGPELRSRKSTFSARVAGERSIAIEFTLLSPFLPPLFSCIRHDSILRRANLAKRQLRFLFILFHAYCLRRLCPSRVYSRVLHRL